jgi:hypothetical protein
MVAVDLHVDAAPCADSASCESPAVSAGHAHKAKAVRALLHGLLPRHTAGLCMCLLPVSPLGGPLMLSVICAWT